MIFGLVLLSGFDDHLIGWTAKKKTDGQQKFKLNIFSPTGVRKDFPNTLICGKYIHKITDGKLRFACFSSVR